MTPCPRSLARSPAHETAAVADSCNIATGGGGLCGFAIDLYLEALLPLLSLLLLNRRELLRRLREILRGETVLRSRLSRRPQPTLEAADPRLRVTTDGQEQGRRRRDHEQLHLASSL